MNKCTQCGHVEPRVSLKRGKATCVECKGENTVLNVEQAFEILNQAILEGFVCINNAEIDTTDDMVYVNYSLANSSSREDEWDELS